MEIKNILHGLDWIHLMIRLWVINMIHAFSERMIRSRKILKFILKIFHCDFPLSSMNHIFSCKMSSPFNASINKMRNRINRNWQQILSRIERIELGFWTQSQTEIIFVSMSCIEFFQYSRNYFGYIDVSGRLKKSGYDHEDVFNKNEWVCSKYVQIFR